MKPRNLTHAPNALPDTPFPHETPSVIRDGSHVQRIEYPEPKRLSSEEASRLDDAQQRMVFLNGHMEYEELSIARVAQLLGDHVSTFGEGRISRWLIADARAGRLRVNGRLDRLSDGGKRSHPSHTPVDADALRE